MDDGDMAVAETIIIHIIIGVEEDDNNVADNAPVGAVLSVRR